MTPVPVIAPVGYGSTGRRGVLDERDDLLTTAAKHKDPCEA
jgi:hypothetical protein